MKIIIALMLLLTILVNAGFSQTINLKQAINVALETNNIINAKKLSFKSSQYAFKSSEGNIYPTIVLQYTHTNTNTQYTSSPTNTPNYIQNSNTLEVSGSMPLYTGGKLSRTIANASLASVASQYNLTEYKNTLIYNVEHVYINLLLAKKHVEVQKMKLRNAENNLHIAKEKFKVGLGTKSDVLTYEAYAAKVKATLEQIKMNFKNYQIQLSYYLNTNKTYTPSNSILYQTINLPKNIHVDLNRLVPIKQQIIQYKIAKNDTFIAMSKFLPQVNLNYSYTRNYSNMPENNINAASININVSLPIFTGFSRINQYQESKLKAMSVNRELNDLKRTTLINIKIAFSNIKYLQSQLSYAKAYVKSSHENYLTTLEKFKYNLSTTYDVDNALTGYYDALFQKIQTKCNLLLAIMKFEELTENVGKYIHSLNGIN